MDFASSVIFADIHNEKEQVYTDEVNDGIAHAAKEQAEVWAIEAEEQGSDTGFVRDLVSLTSKYISARAGQQRAGELGTKSRLQPRYQKGKALEYDRVVSARVRDERWRRSKRTGTQVMATREIRLPHVRTIAAESSLHV